jgi:ribose-phosphate pyrophosphokinase
MDNICVISGNSHPLLVEKICKHLEIPLFPAKMQYFANGEIRPIIEDSIRGKDVYIVQTGASRGKHSINDHIMETILLAKTCKRSDANSITLISPLYPYARQDKKDNPRGSISARDVADMFEMSGINRIISFDLHSAQIQGFANIPIDNLYAINRINTVLKELLFDEFRERKEYKDMFVAVAPDEGALKRTMTYANKFDIPFVVLGKVRDYSKLNVVEKSILIGDPKYIVGRVAIVIDDMVDTMGTILKTSETLIDNGVSKIIVVVTHGILSGPAIDRLNMSKNVDMLICSNSICHEENKKKSDKLIVYDISDMIANVIRTLNEGGSISKLFK